MSDLEAKLKKRLTETMQTRTSEQLRITQLQAELKKLFAKMPRRGRETLEDLDKKIRDLETERTTTSLSLAEERQILKQIHGIQRSKGQVEDQRVMEEKIQVIKAQLDELKPKQSTLRTSIQELETALAKVKLANSVGCSTQELTTIQVECPKDKVGSIIGKQGSMLQQLMDKHKVAIDVDKDTFVASITGNSSSVESAKKAILAIATSVDMEIDLRPEVVTYLTSPRIGLFTAMRSKYDDIHLDLPRSVGKLIMRGAAERVEQAKGEIMDIQVTSRERTLHGRQFIHLLGPKGVNIDKLVQEFNVVIDVTKNKEDDTAEAKVIGPIAQVEACMEAIQDLMESNQEVSESIEMEPVMKQILLADAGSNIKALQERVTDDLRKEDDTATCYLSFSKDRQADPELIVKAKQSIIDHAVALTKEGLEAYKNLIVFRTADPYAVPSLIGKGGETIKQLTQDKSMFLEVDRKTGKVTIGATTSEDRDSLLAQVDQILDDNTVARIAGDPELMEAQFRELMRSKTRNLLQDIARVDIDEKAKEFLLRGKKDDLEKAKAIFNEFIENNRLDEVTVLDEDFDSLLSGGKGSKITSLSQELEVNLSADRSKGIVAIRGTAANVSNAKKVLDSFLNGGDGQGVAKLSITNEVVGVIVGKGGKTRKELEEKHQVSIHISREYKVSIRGPVEGVNKCRVEILKLVSSAKVTQEVAIKDEDKAKLEKNDALKRISQQSSCQVSVEDEKVRIRGGFFDVRDGVSLVNELFTGVYKTLIEVGSSQYSRLSATCRDPSHLQRMELATDSKISLEAGRVEISGKRSNVKKGKAQFYDFLAFVCPGEIERLKITKPLFSTVGSRSSLAEVSANTGASVVFLDRDLSCIIALDSDSDRVKAASSMIAENTREAERLAFVQQIAPDDAWLLTYIIGKNGSRIQALRKGSECQIDVSKETRTITITGTSEDQVAALREKLAALIEKGRRENVFITLPEKAIPGFVGRGGQHLKDWSAEYGVDIQRVRRSNQFKIVGEEDKVGSFKSFVEDWLSQWQASNATVEMSIEKQHVAAILGEKGSTAQAIEKEFGCRLDVDRKDLKITVKGADPDKRQEALDKIKAILEEVAAARATAAAERKARLDAAKAVAPTPEEKPESPVSPVSDRENNRPSQPEAAPKDQRAYPSTPVGLQQPTKKKNGKKGSPKADVVVEYGTEKGRDLFNLLLGQ